MRSEEFYRDVDPRWCQGDIIRQVPHIHMKLPLRAVRREQTARGGERLTPFAYPFGIAESEGHENTSPPGGFKFSNGEQVTAFCQLAFGIVLTHGCEIDKDSKHRQVALIRPLSPLPAQDQQTIRENRNFSYCYLPAYSDVIAESYVDFRRITTLHPDFLLDTERVLSLTDEAVNYLEIQFIRYVTRRNVSPEVLKQLPINP